MWILILLLIIILIALLFLILCCICEGCPLYIPASKRSLRSKSVPEEAHLVHVELHKEKGTGFENKSVQAVDWRHATRKEAWSADIAERRTKSTHWQFNRRNQKNKDTVSLYTDRYDNGSLKDIRADEKSTMRLRDGPNIIYSKEWQNRNRNLDRDIYLEDMNNDYASIHKSHQVDTKHPNHIDDLDAESLKRHEIERGSDTEYRNSLRRSFRRQRAHDDDEEQSDVRTNGRDQFFIREGNTEILRLVTRGKAEEISQARNNQHQGVTYVASSQPQYIMLDGGKEILMQRFIDQQHIHHPNQVQQEFVHKTQMQGSSDVNNQRDNESSSVPVNSPSKSHRTTPTHELLESSLRQQNELLRQILLEKEKIQERQDSLLNQENKLETQSLPGQSVMGTQTDCNAETQTDLTDLRPAKRKTRSDNDDSASEDDDYDIYIIGDGSDNLRWVKQKKYRRKSRDKRAKRIARVVADVQRKIKTPIIEESESPFESLDKQSLQKIDRLSKNYGETKSSILRRKKSEEHAAKEEKDKLKLEEEKRKRPMLRKEVLIEISGSLSPNISVSQPTQTCSKTQDAMLEYYDSDQESTNGDLYSAKVGRFKEVFSDDSLDSIGHINAGNQTDCKALEKNKRNAVFSRQGSSTDAKETSEYETKSISFSINDDNNLRKSSSEQVIRKTIEFDIKKSSTTPVMKSTGTSTKKLIKKKPEDKKIDVSKSTPRYMQWYKNKKERDKQHTESDEKSSNKIKKEPKKNSKKPKIETKESTEKVKITISPTKDDSEQEKQSTMKEQLQQNAPTETQSPQGRPLLQHSEHRYEHTYPYPSINYAQPAQIPQHLYQQPVILMSPISGHPAFPHPMPQQADHIVQFSSIEQMNNVNEHTFPHNITNSKQQISPANKNLNNNVEETLEDNKTKMKSTGDAMMQTISDIDGKHGGENLLKVAGVEDENDSGIAMNTLLHGGMKRPQITEKKSVFTIAYDDVHTKQIRADSDSPPY